MSLSGALRRAVADRNAFKGSSMTQGIGGRGITVDGGWSIDSNAFASAHFDAGITPLDDTVLFSAVNGLSGVSLTLSFENAQAGYALECLRLSRDSETWALDEARSERTVLAAGRDPEALYALLPALLNPLGKPLAPLRISSWTIITNELMACDADTPVGTPAFSATRGRLFVDVTRTNHARHPYRVSMGRTRQPHTGLNRQVDAAASAQRTLHLTTLAELSSVLDALLTEYDAFLDRLPEDD